MSSPLSIVRVYRILVGCAILHALLITLWFILSATGVRLFESLDAGGLWIALTTLWICWPIVLVLHPGRSMVWLLVALVVSGVFLYPSFPNYDFIAARAFGLPEGVYSLSPRAIWNYFSAYRAGRRQAESDLRLGNLAHEELGIPMPGEYYRSLRERYQIEPRVRGDLLDEKIISYARGYNEIAEPAIKRKFGRDVITETSDEAFKNWNEAQAKRNP